MAVMDSFDDVTLVLLLLAASIVELIAAGIVCDDINDIPGAECEDEYAYAVAVGAVSTFFTLLMAICFLVGSLRGVAAKMNPFMAIFLLLWWIPGAGVLTFREPFKGVGNGYYASWAALILSVFYFGRAAMPMISGVAAKVGNGGGSKAADPEAGTSSA